MELFLEGDDILFMVMERKNGFLSKISVFLNVHCDAVLRTKHLQLFCGRCSYWLRFVLHPLFNFALLFCLNLFLNLCLKLFNSIMIKEGSMRRQLNQLTVQFYILLL